MATSASSSQSTPPTPLPAGAAGAAAPGTAAPARRGIGWLRAQYQRLLQFDWDPIGQAFDRREARRARQATQRAEAATARLVADQTRAVRSSATVLTAGATDAAAEVALWGAPGEPRVDAHQTPLVLDAYYVNEGRLNLMAALPDLLPGCTLALDAVLPSWRLHPDEALRQSLCLWLYDVPGETDGWSAEREATPRDADAGAPWRQPATPEAPVPPTRHCPAIGLTTTLRAFTRDPVILLDGSDRYVLPRLAPPVLLEEFVPWTRHVPVPLLMALVRARRVELFLEGQHVVLDAAHQTLLRDLVSRLVDARKRWVGPFPPDPVTGAGAWRRPVPEAVPPPSPSPGLGLR